MTCTRCGADDHKTSSCPWPIRCERTLMKRTLIALAVTALLSGCAGLSINMDAAISYRSDVPLGERKP
jgi:hypothetical protein